MNYLEIELKTLLTKTEFDSLQEHFATVTPVHQTNYYIDTVDFSFRQSRMALRIRTFDDKAELTLKIPQTVGVMEYNQELSPSESQEILEHCKLPQGEILQILQETAIDLKQLKVLGSLTTIRQEMQTAIGLMALDKSHYFDKTDYELELEVTDEEQGKKDFQAFLEENHIVYKPIISKIARFAQNL